MANPVPHFFLGNPNQLFELEEITDWDALEMLFSSDDEIGGLQCDVAASTSETAQKEMEAALQPNKSVPTVAEKRRFKSVTEAELKNLQECRQSKATRKNTKWGLKLFQEWSTEALGQETDFFNINADYLNTLLGRFYAEACPKSTEKRERELSTEKAAEYHKNTMKNIRSALNRHIRDIGRDFDIVRNRTFRSANDILDGKLKYNLQHGVSRATKHKEIIFTGDLLKISSYLYSECSPVVLRYRVWYDISMNFISRGLEFHQQLNPKSFIFSKDENGTEFVTLSHETKEKNWQGGLDGSENPSDKRMYASENSDRCPVASLKLLISKTDPNAKSLFNHCSKTAMKSPESEEIWYTSESVKFHQFTQFMSDISRHSKCTKTYTAHCIRATAIQAMNDAGYELRHIMYMTGHRNESSVRSYNRECSVWQNKSISNTLSSLSSGNVSSDALVPVSTVSKQLSTAETAPTEITPSSNLPLTLNSSNSMSSGFISNSSFNHCVFHFAGSGTNPRN